MINQQFVPEAVLFDMDGLMLDTEGPVLPFWYTVMEKYGYSLSEEILYKTIGIPAVSTEKMLKEIYGADFPYDKITEELEQMVQDDIDKNGIPQKKGLLTLLDHLDKLGIPKAVATSTRREKALWKLQHSGIKDRFPIVVSVDDVKRGKPAPDLFLAAAEKLGKKPEHCVGFEDSTAGLQSLSAAGIKSVFVKDILEPPEEVLNTVWHQFSHLAEAVKLFC
jgi:HAD superfamily hydrolase (TIGR01509 family)